MDKTGIANLALSNLGESSIQSLTDNNARARACNGRIDDVITTVLRMHVWNSALERKELTQKEAIEILSKIFKHIIKILNERYIIYTSLTAVFDSRLLMSATKEISQNITYYTFQRINSKKNLTNFK